MVIYRDNMVGVIAKESFLDKVESVYKEMIKYFTIDNINMSKKFLQRLDQSGFLELKLWPMLLSHSSGEKENDASSYDPKYSILFVVLINLQKQKGGFSFSSLSNPSQGNKTEEASHSTEKKQKALEILINDALDIYFDLIKSISSDEGVGSRLCIINEIICFISNCYTSFFDSPSLIVNEITREKTKRAKYSYKSISTLHEMCGLHLWHQMESKQRELELRKSTQTRLQWKMLLLKSKQKNQNNSNQDYHLFIPLLIDTFLYLLQQHERGGEVDDDETMDDSDNDTNSSGSNTDHVEGKKTFSPTKNAVQSFLQLSLNLLIDLLSILSTRKYLQPFLKSTNFAIHCGLCLSSSLFSGESKLNQLLSMLNDYQNFPISIFSSSDNSDGSVTGKSLTVVDEPKSLSPADVQKKVHLQCHAFQQILHKYFISSGNESSQLLIDFVYSGVAFASQKSVLLQYMIKLSVKDLTFLAFKMRLISQSDLDRYGDREEKTKDFLVSCLVQYQSSLCYESSFFTMASSNLNCNENNSNKDSKSSNTKSSTILSLPTLIKQLPIYPTENLLWDKSLLTNSYQREDAYLHNQSDAIGGIVHALPKLNIEFLSLSDYLLRSFKLVRLESSYSIRDSIADAVKRVCPVVEYEYGSSGMDDEDIYNGTYGNDTNDFHEGNRKTKTGFRGWARMAIEINDFQVTQVTKPKLGENIPSRVVGTIEIDLHPLGTAVRNEWESLREFDNLFLVSIDASKAHNNTGVKRKSCDDDGDNVFNFPSRYGIQAVRGCMLVEMQDEAGNILNDPFSSNSNNNSTSNGLDKNTKQIPKGEKRILKVELDASQYALDSSYVHNEESGNKKNNLEVYNSFNLLVRRHGRENNFKAILETIRSIMISSSQQQVETIGGVPRWLNHVLLGYGDPSCATYSSNSMKAYAQNTFGVSNPDAALDYGDLFLNQSHLIKSYPDNYKILIDGKERQLTADQQEKENHQEVRKNYKVKVLDDSQFVEATSYPFFSSSIKYRQKHIKGNSIPFTPRQVQAVRSGLSPGLTLIVGPPGTGKTDVAVQIIANLYHSFPTQRTVIVTHSNAALNDLFEKVMSRGDIDERYMLRLGSGEKDLQVSSEHDFTKQGRVEHILARRNELLEKVQVLAESLGVSTKQERGMADNSSSYTCETAEYFHLHHVVRRIQIFETSVKEKNLDNDSNENISTFFPFHAYFESLSEFEEKQELRSSMTIRQAKELFEEIHCVFKELAEYRPLELLRSQRQRTDYLLLKQAKIVAMTCTHAAIARSHLIESGFQYDNILIEEAGQMLEIETFIPMLLQKGTAASSSHSNFGDGTKVGSIGSSRLKRICLIGDHNQLPPIVKNLTFARYSNLDQSLFARMLRLGVPSILLDKQGRARPEIAELYSWRYQNLGNLDHVYHKPMFLSANPGFLHTFQMINVEDYEGRGESTPTPYFYQNVGEAEYIVAVFQYMVLIGYPPEKISLLTTYNGQKELLRDIVSQRCGPNTPLAGVQPGSISTVDQYQGQQNDYILLSLVRTESVGYLRDIRRLIVAVSRARLGLYVFGRRSLFFETCHELQKTLHHFTEKDKSFNLKLVTQEHFDRENSVNRKANDTAKEEQVKEVKDVSEMGQIVFSMQEHLCT